MTLSLPIPVDPDSAQAGSSPLQKARYRRVVDPLHRGNPFLLALPNRLEPKQVLKQYWAAAIMIKLSAQGNHGRHKEAGAQ